MARSGAKPALLGWARHVLTHPAQKCKRRTSKRRTVTGVRVQLFAGVEKTADMVSRRRWYGQVKEITGCFALHDYQWLSQR